MFIIIARRVFWSFLWLFVRFIHIFTHPSTHTRTSIYFKSYVFVLFALPLVRAAAASFKKLAGIWGKASPFSVLKKYCKRYIYTIWTHCLEMCLLNTCVRLHVCIYLHALTWVEIGILWIYQPSTERHFSCINKSICIKAFCCSSRLSSYLYT